MEFPRTRGSRNRAKAARRLARHPARVASRRRDRRHQLTTRLASTHGRIVVEDPNVKGRLRGHRLARALTGFGGYEFSRQLRQRC